jgi:hypothetical protein
MEEYLENFMIALVKEISQKQTNLYNDPQLIKYDNKILKKTRVEGVIGGHHAQLFVFEKYFLKKHTQIHAMNEALMYYIFHNQFKKLTDYIPKIYGLIYISKGTKLTQEMLENMFQIGYSNKEDIVFFPFQK